METIKQFFAREPVNKGRQVNVDLLKAISILFMVVCHTVIFMGTEYDSFLYIFADVYIGSYFGVAHAFMLAMGIGMVFSHKNSPKQLILRGVKLIFIGYLLNFARSGIYYLLFSGFSNDFFFNLFLSDILQFAGLANITVGVFKACKLKNLHIFLISLVLSVAGSFVYHVECGSSVLNVLVGFFVNTGAAAGKETPDDYSCFVFFAWFIFVALGLVLGDVIQRCKNLDRMYCYFTIIGFAVGVIYLIVVNLFNVNYLNFLNSGYSISTLDAIGYIGIDFFLLGVFYFLSKKVDQRNYRFAITTAKNILPIYLIHWILVSFINFIIVYILEVSPPLLALYPLGLLIWAVSALLSIWINRLQGKKKQLK